jgi:PucR family transcriptional regulator, purine catabolism regulatory protein
MTRESGLTIEEILKRPLFEYAQVTAGKQGLPRPIRWVHILETAENASFLNGGELILSTGVGFGEKHLFYLSEVIRRKAAGLCIELGTYISEIPADMRELADHHGFPLIVFTQPVRFVDITLDLHEYIINIHNKALRELESYSRHLQQLTLQTQSLSKVILHFQSIVHTQSFFFLLDDSSIAPDMPQTVQCEITELIRSSLLKNDILPDTSGILTVSIKKKILYQPVVAMGNVLAYLCVVLYEREPDEYLYLTLDYTATAMAQILLRTMFARELTLGNENRLIEDILIGRGNGEQQIRELLGISGSALASPYWSVILEIQEKQRYSDETDSPFHDMLAVFRTVLSQKGFRPILYSRRNRLYLLLLSSRPTVTLEHIKQALKKIEHSCRKVIGSNGILLFGVSNVSSDYADINHSFKEAEQVLAFGADSGSPFFIDLGVYRLLLQIKDNKALITFVEDYLGPLLHQDTVNGTNLFQTLRAFLENGLSKQLTSEKLYIHRQTLYHRLNRIKEIIGENYLLPQNRLSYEIAFKAYDWVYSQNNKKV